MLETLVDKSHFEEVKMRKSIKQIQERKVKMTGLFTESVNRADVMSIVNNIKLANDKGMLDSQSNFLTFLRTLTSNLKKSPKGKRYDDFTKELYHGLAVHELSTLCQQICVVQLTAQFMPQRRQRSNL